MMRRSTRPPKHQHSHSVSAQLAVFNDRLEATERRQRQLENTMAALGREVGVSIGCPCARCEESYTLIKAGSMYCPRCGHQQSL